MSLPMDIRLPPEFLKKLQPENENSPLCKPLSRMSRRASLVCDTRLHRSARLHLSSRSQTLIRLANASMQMLTFSFILFALTVSLLIHSQKLVSLLGNSPLCLFFHQSDIGFGKLETYVKLGKLGEVRWHQLHRHTFSTDVPTSCRPC